MDYGKQVSVKATPQMEPTFGKKEVVNAAGGYVFSIDEWSVLDRFLILGTEGGTYYVSEKKLTLENAKAIEKLIAIDGVRVVNRTAEISYAGRASNNDAALFVLAMAVKLGNDETRSQAYKVLPEVARIGTHLFHWASFCDSMGKGWSRGLRTAVANWYNNKPIDSLVYQSIKYQSRDGWSHRDLLRLSHAKAPSEDYNELYKWITSGELKENMSDRLRVVQAVEEMKHLVEAKDVASYIKNFNLPREVVPTQFLNSKEVWEALLPTMGLEALVRNLGKMSSIGLIEPFSDVQRLIVDKLSDDEVILKSRLHPIKVLTALMTYKNGHGNLGSNTWKPDAKVIDALDSAFYKAFGNVEATGKRFLLGLDVSGSMSWTNLCGVDGLTPRVASAVMALVSSAVEKNTLIGAFTAMDKASRGYSGQHNYKGTNDPDSGFSTLNISNKQRLDDVLKTVAQLVMGATDCSLPMLWALKHKIPVDAFVIYTDNESWSNEKIKPFQALDMYRQKMGIAAKAIAVGMSATNYSVFDDNDPLCLNVVGFDTNTPNLISEFVK